MTPQNRVRTYLDPDTVGPLPRATFADDSDELSNARTMVQEQLGASTVEIRPEDVIDIFDPNRPRSIAPVGIDTAIVLPRGRLGPYVVAVVSSGVAVFLFAVIVGMRSQPAAPEASATPASAPAVQTVARSTVQATATTGAAPAPAPADPPAASQPGAAPAATTGTLRIDQSVDGQRVLVDGVVLSATAAMVRCGAHDIAVGTGGRTRTIDVPCGGEVTVYR